jgi:biotin synthase
MLAGANSIFFGDKLLTTANPEFDADMSLLAAAGIEPLEPSARP